MTNVEKAANDFYGRVCERIDAIYDSSKCKTREDLVRLIDGEVIELMKLQQFTNDGLRDACYEGLRKDGIEFPKILWAQYVGTKIKVPYYSSIREEVPQEQFVNTKPTVTEHEAVQQEMAGKAVVSKSPNTEKIVVISGVVTGLTGVVLKATDIVAGAISSALIALGICCVAATGVVKVVSVVQKSTRPVRSEARPAAVPDASAQQSRRKEEELVAGILHEQRERCKQYAKKWCEDVLDIVRAGVEQSRAEE